MKISNLESEAETTYATGGRGNPRLISWDYSRTPTFMVQDALMSPDSLGMLMGNKPEVGVKHIHKREILQATEGDPDESVIELSHEPIEGSLTAYVTGEGYYHTDEDEVEGTITSSEVTFDDTDVPVGDNVVVYYEYESEDTAVEVKMTADDFPGYYKFVGDTIIRNERTGEDEPFQIVIPKVKIQPNFTITMEAEGDPSVFDLNMDIFREDGSTDMVRMIKY